MVQTVMGRERPRGIRVNAYGRGAAGAIAALFAWAIGSNRRAVTLLLGLCAVAFLPGFFALPPVDRDEARFAQITRQMVETGAYTVARIGDEPNHTRPLALHWVQAVVVKTGEALGVPDATRTIWLYRIPSLAGAVAAVLLVFWAALGFVGRPGATLAGIFIASSAALDVGARLAIPEAIFLAAIAAMTGALGRAYLAAHRERPLLFDDEAPRQGGDSVDSRLALIFWGALCVALVVKGLQAPLYPAFAVAGLVALDRSPRFLRVLAPLRGLIALAVIAGLWAYARHLSAESAAGAVQQAVGRVAPDQRGLVGPPGIYLLMFWGLFWPAAPLAALAVPIVWKARRLRAVRALLVWIVPAWIVFELVPAKLAGNVVPTFPAIAILIALAMERGAMAIANTRLVRLLWLWPIVGAAIAVAVLLGLAVFDGTTSLLAWPLLIAGFFFLVTAATYARDYGLDRAALLGIAGMLISGFGVMHLILPRMDSVWISPRLAAMAAGAACGGRPAEIAAVGYSEPSLMFQLAGPVHYMEAPAAAEFLGEGGCRAALVERREERRFALRAEALGLHIMRGQDLRGFNMNTGRRVRIALYRASRRDW
ncbi:glycosyl transferase [Ancylobacter sp. 6x-1]|uniref:Glycosyl transferase n=1 Tax=Ancylobacter crimeensis TaxID=2579147 RepID=A0ABT0DG85_9HYPH|nr:glycosyl transferase [Ancylobacter crimeensis]MCK0198889.1 glycosyl transferase [Ancylobacter crimeensis]